MVMKKGSFAVKRTDSDDVTSTENGGIPMPEREPIVTGQGVGNYPFFS